MNSSKEPRKNILLLKKCEICHNEYQRPKGLAYKLWDARRFCGRKCLGESMRGKIPKNILLITTNKDGENNPMWKGGKTTENYRLRRSKEFSGWRTKVYTRDKFICQKCKEIGGKLHPHHILNWEIHLEERFNPENGITLCNLCHRVFHKIYGYRNNTKEQIRFFLKQKEHPISYASVKRVLTRVHFSS